MHKWLIEVGYKDRETDSIGRGVKADILEDLRIKGIEDVNYIDVYEVNADLNEAEIKKIAEKLFLDPITQEYSINSPLGKGFDWAIEVRLHGDVTDNVGITAMQGISDLLGKELMEGESVRSIRKYLVKAKIGKKDIEKICKGMLANEVIETYSYRKGTE